MPLYTPQCSRCHVYPAAPQSSICSRCSSEQRQERDALEREQRHTVHAGCSPVPRNTVPYCGSCLTTLHVRDVDHKTGVGLCVQCKLKQRRRRVHTLASSYGQHTAKQQDPNSIY